MASSSPVGSPRIRRRMHGGAAVDCREKNQGITRPLMNLGGNEWDPLVKYAAKCGCKWK